MPSKRRESIVSNSGNNNSVFVSLDERLNGVFDFPSFRNRYTTRSLIASYVIDWIFIAIMYLIVGGFSLAPKPDIPFTLDDPSLSYPLVKEIIPVWMFFLLCIAVPIMLFAIIYLMVRIKNAVIQRQKQKKKENKRNWAWRRDGDQIQYGYKRMNSQQKKNKTLEHYTSLDYIDIHDLHHAILGLLASVMISLIFSSFLWIVVGGLRPNHYAECIIQKDKIIPGKKMYTVKEICSPKAFQHVIQTPGFPSGHAANAFSSWIFTFLYLNGKFKIWDDYSHAWKILLCFILPLLISAGVSCSRFLDYRHSGSQILFGSILGIIAAFIGYRLYFCSWFDNRINHLPTCTKWISKPGSEETRNVTNDEDNLDSIIIEDDNTAEPLIIPIRNNNLNQGTYGTSSTVA